MGKEQIDGANWRKDIAASALRSQLLSDADLVRSVDNALHHWPCQSDVWLFAYGSLVWKPQLEFTEMQVGRLYGYHRSFCLWSRINRGTPEKPGLVLGLDRGGSCGGLAYRIPASTVKSQLLQLWQREMLLGSYRPLWVHFHSGSSKSMALTFVVNRHCSGYTGSLSDAAMLEALQSAHGRFGSCADYLTRTVQALSAHGISDRRLLRLHHLMHSAKK